jgi:hypothetical protein
MTKRQQLKNLVQKTPIYALGLILAGEFDGVKEADDVKAIFAGKKKKRKKR